MIFLNKNVGGHILHIPHGMPSAHRHTWSECPLKVCLAPEHTLPAAQYNPGCAEHSGVFMEDGGFGLLTGGMCYKHIMQNPAFKVPNPCQHHTWGWLIRKIQVRLTLAAAKQSKNAGFQRPLLDGCLQKDAQ